MKDSRGEEDGGVDGAECQAGATGLRSDLRAAHSPVKLRSGAGRRYTKKSFDTEYDGGKKKNRKKKLGCSAFISASTSTNPERTNRKAKTILLLLHSFLRIHRRQIPQIPARRRRISRIPYLLGWPGAPARHPGGRRLSRDAGGPSPTPRPSSPINSMHVRINTLIRRRY